MSLLQACPYCCQQWKIIVLISPQLLEQLIIGSIPSTWWRTQVLSVKTASLPCCFLVCVGLGCYSSLHQYLPDLCWPGLILPEILQLQQPGGKRQAKGLPGFFGCWHVYVQDKRFVILTDTKTVWNHKLCLHFSGPWQLQPWLWSWPGPQPVLVHTWLVENITRPSLTNIHIIH